MVEGTPFGRYQLIKKLAVGGMAEIFLAKQHGPGHFERSLVIKRILPHLAQDPKFVEMFLDEASLAAQLNHPNIAQVYDFGAEGDSYYIAMELIRGPDLANVIGACRKVISTPPLEIAIRIITQVASALDYAHHATDDHGHALGLVHRDVSPQNVLVSYDGVVKLVDFGIAKAAGASHQTEAGMVKGKFSYMAPEQLRGDKLDGRCDEYATGLLLYELLTLTQGLPGDGPSAIAAALEARIEPLVNLRSQLPAELVAIVNRSLRADREERFRDCREFQEALDGWLLSHAISVRQHEVSLFLAGLQQSLGSPLSPITSAAGKAQSKAPGTPPEPSLTPSAPRGPRELTPTDDNGDTAISPSASRRAELGTVAGGGPIADAETRMRPGAPPTLAPPAAHRPFPWPVVVAAALITVGAGAWFLTRGEPPTATPPAHADPIAVKAPEPAHPAAAPVPHPAPTVVATPAPTPTPTAASHHEHRAPPTPAAAHTATLSVSSEPATEAFLDGSDLGPTPVAKMKVSAGKHTLRLANADLAISHLTHLTLAAGETHHEAVHLGKGKVFFAVKPWANITFAGQPLGQTPLDPHVAYEGTYDVVVENPRLQKIVRRKVTVEAGQTTFLKVDLTQG